jgi:hypothetical protein
LLSGRNLYAHRDATMILIAHRRGLCAVVEVVALQWHGRDTIAKLPELLDKPPK